MSLHVHVYQITQCYSCDRRSSVLAITHKHTHTHTPDMPHTLLLAPIRSPSHSDRKMEVFHSTSCTCTDLKSKVSAKIRRKLSLPANEPKNQCPVSTIVNQTEKDCITHVHVLSRFILKTNYNDDLVKTFLSSLTPSTIKQSPITSNLGNTRTFLKCKRNTV